MTFSGFVLSNISLFALALELTLLAGQLLFISGYLRRNKFINTSFFFHVIGIILFSWWLISIYVATKAQDTLWLAYASFLFFYPGILLSLLLGNIAFVIGFIKANTEEQKLSFRKVILVVLLGYVAIFSVGNAYIYYRDQQHKQLVNEVIASKFGGKFETLSDSSWKKYISDKGYFSVEYPATWNYSFSGSSGQYKTLYLSGKEGNVNISWGMGFGGMCGDGEYQKIEVGGEMLEACYIFYEGKETWRLIGKVLPETSISISAQSFPSGGENKELVLKMLKMIKFNVYETTTTK